MWEFLEQGGPIMTVLMAASLISLAFILERGWVLRWGRVLPRTLLVSFENWKVKPEAYEALIGHCRSDDSTLGRLMLYVSEHSEWSHDELVDGLQSRARQEVIRLERGLVVLEIVVGVAPLLGLMGTIQGLMTLFAGIGDLGEADGAILAKGIALALNTTMAGLLVSIPSLVAWSYFNKKVEALGVALEGVCGDFLRRLLKHRSAGG